MLRSRVDRDGRKGPGTAAARFIACRRDKIEVIPHGIPDMPFLEPDRAKAKLGFAGRPSS